MANFTHSELASLSEARLLNFDKISSVSSVSIDTRTISAGALYIAIVGKKFEGHDFIGTAIEKGAVAIMVNRSQLKNLVYVNTPTIVVKNTTTALRELSGLWRNKLKTKIIGITGSVGKTSTKEITAQLLAEKFSTVATTGNNNNHIGVPLTLLSIPIDCETAVIELGTNHPGEIEYTASVVKPDFGLITNIGNSHLEFLKDMDGVLTEKIALFDQTFFSGGKVILNIDDKKLAPLLEAYPHAITYGFSDKADIRGEITCINDNATTKLKVTYEGNSFEVDLPLFGVHNAQNVLAAAGICLLMSMKHEDIIAGITKLTPQKQRLVLKSFPNFDVFDDTYNANPESMAAALSLLSSYKLRKKKIAILGDMFELGEDTFQLHIALFKEIKKNNIDAVYTVGKAMRQLDAIVYPGVDMIQFFFSRVKLAELLNNNLFTDTVFLVKGSRGMKMEEFVHILENKI